MKIQLISHSLRRRGMAEVVIHDSYVDKRGKTVVKSQTRHVRVERDGTYWWKNADGKDVGLMPESAGVVQ